VPAQQQHPAPHEQLRDLGIQARREAVSFEAFWERAVRPGMSPIITTETKDPPSNAVIWPRDSTDRNNSMAAIRSSEETWRRAYEGAPQTSAERAFGVLRELLSEGVGGSEDRSEVALLA
jgi:hypothetical protein